MSKLLIALIAVLTFTACDSGLDSPPLFDALEGTWDASVGEVPSSIRFLDRGRYEFVSDGEVTEQGRYSIATIGDSGALTSLQNIQFYSDSEDPSLTYFTVASADPSSLALQLCASNCEGVAVQVYDRR